MKRHKKNIIINYLSALINRLLRKKMILKKRSWTIIIRSLSLKKKVNTQKTKNQHRLNKILWQKIILRFCNFKIIPQLKLQMKELFLLKLKKYSIVVKKLASFNLQKLKKKNKQIEIARLSWLILNLILNIKIS